MKKRTSVLKGNTAEKKSKAQIHQRSVKTVAGQPEKPQRASESCAGDAVTPDLHQKSRTALMDAFRGQGWIVSEENGVIYATIPHDEYVAASKKAERIVAETGYRYSWGIRPEAMRTA